jgi:hypothetical protein
MPLDEQALHALHASGDADGWNLTRWDPATVDPRKGHLESTFIKLNDPSSARALWVKVTIFAPTYRTSGGPPFARGETVAEAWAIAFDHAGDEPSPASYRDAPRAERPAPRARHVAVKQTVPIAEATLARERPFRLQVAGVEVATEAGGALRLRGEVEHGEARVRFDLLLTPRDRAPLVPFPHAAMYTGAFPKSKLVSPILDALAEGTVDVDRATGEHAHWDVHAWPAMQGHNWGTRHADLYAWAHCNCWREPEGRELVLEGLSGRVRVGPVKTPLLTVVAVRWRGVRYEARSIGEILKARGAIDGHRRWTFEARHADAVIAGSLTMRDDDVVGLYYPNPDGEMTYCLNSKLAHATLRFAPRGRPPLTLTSDAAALEIGTHAAQHGARMYV